MKMKCAHCGVVINSKCNYCNLCGESTRKQRSRHGMIVIGGIAAFLIACVILHINYLMPWQIPLYKDRKAIIQYARENHPDSKIVEEHIKYRLEGFYFIITGASPDCYITFEEDGFQYRVFASNEKVYADNYSRKKLWHEIEEFITEGYLKPKGIKNVDIYCSFNPDDDELPSEWSEYNDTFWVTLKVRGQGVMPQQIYWLWDFCKFWRDNQNFGSKWSVSFDLYYGTDKNALRGSSISINHYDDFKSKEEWYEARTYISNPRLMD